MGRYVSIRGWIECDDEDVQKIKSIVEEYKTKEEWIKKRLDRDKLTLYQNAWRFPLSENSFNWTTYIFYGADIRSEYLDYIREQLELIAKLNNENEGFFMCRDEEADENDEWIIKNGRIIIK